uniref:GPALPP motifs-containing protein 1 n=1 Tax=Denticeps clupeoides TaxID=299321 RepID=A0AAY4B9J3_9TELE
MINLRSLHLFADKAHALTCVSLCCSCEFVLLTRGKFWIPVIGPALPPVYSPEDSSSSSDDGEVVFKRARRDQQSNDGFFGPALPPGYRKQEISPDRPPMLGPALPPGFHRPDDDDDDGDDDNDCGFAGPSLPPGYKAEQSSSDGEDEDIIGPMPSMGVVQDSVALDIEKRAQKMKDKLLGIDNEPKELKRETWMTELPPELQHIGLGPRTFKKRSGPEDKDRSIWTDTPAERERKEQLEGKESGASQKDVPQPSQRELEIAKQVSKYNDTKRGESLINMHMKKMKSKAEEDAKKPVERRPFDRDNDLQVNRFDEAQKKALLKKSQELNTRFSHSKDRMFL